MTVKDKNQNDIMNQKLINSFEIDYIYENKPINRFRGKPEIENILQPHEAQLLKLDSSKAKTKLAWKNQWNLEITLNKTIEWYQAWRNQEDMKDISISQINCYEEQMEKVRIRNK